MTSNTAESLPNYFRPKLYAISIIAAALALIGILLISRYASLDLRRDLTNWQDKLNLIATSRTEEVSKWVDSHFSELKKLSQNPSLQLYVAEIKTDSKGRPGAMNRLTPSANAPEKKADEPKAADAKGKKAEAKPAKPAAPSNPHVDKSKELLGALSPDAEEAAQKTYLRNLLTFTADRMGFSPESVPLSINIPTQIDYDAPSGIAVLDTDNSILVSTPYLKRLDQHIVNQLKSIPPSTPALIDLYPGESGMVKIGFVVPVYGIQDDPGKSPPIARIVGVKLIGKNFFKLLEHPGTTEETLEAILVRREAGNIAYLSPLANGTGPMEKSIKDAPEQLASSFAIDSPKAFTARRNYRGDKVLVTGQNVPGTPWTLVMEVNYDEAMAPSDLRRNGMIVMFLLAVGLVVLTVVAVWYSASSRRAVLASRYFKDMADRTAAQKKLLTLVSDNQPEAIYIIDKDHKYHFGNHHAALELDVHEEDIAGKTVNDVLGTARAEEVVSAAEKALAEQKQISRIRRYNKDGKELIIRTEYLPLDHIPVSGLPEKTPGVLIVEQDISEVVHEREGRIRLHQQLIETLVTLVDRRDPNAANHSKMVSKVAAAVADSMGLDKTTCESIRIAGSLMNIGKIVISPAVLTKRESLSEKERKDIQDSISNSAELLNDISFEGPVVENLRQVQERWDGSGPQGLKEEGILIGARILSVVNAFVGMISPRSYREAMAVERALKVLLEKTDTLYDRKVVVSLANYMENQGGKETIEKLKAA